MSIEEFVKRPRVPRQATKKRCFHRWTKNNVCVIPGCGAHRQPDQVLKPGERNHGQEPV